MGDCQVCHRGLSGTAEIRALIFFWGLCVSPTKEKNRIITVSMPEILNGEKEEKDLFSHSWHSGFQPASLHRQRPVVLSITGRFCLLPSSSPDDEYLGISSPDMVLASLPLKYRNDETTFSKSSFYNGLPVSAEKNSTLAYPRSFALVLRAT